MAEIQTVCNNVTVFVTAGRYTDGNKRKKPAVNTSADDIFTSGNSCLAIFYFP